MPRNYRPGTYLGGLDPDWEGSTRTERKLAQNQYDIEEQLEQLNQNLKLVQESNKLERLGFTIYDYCKMIGIDYNQITNYMNNYNQKVISEIPDITSRNEQIYKLEQDENVNSGCYSADEGSLYRFRGYVRYFCTSNFNCSIQ